MFLSQFRNRARKDSQEGVYFMGGEEDDVPATGPIQGVECIAVLLQGIGGIADPMEECEEGLGFLGVFCEGFHNQDRFVPADQPP
jgi:hypothetical protein